MVWNNSSLRLLRPATILLGGLVAIMMLLGIVRGLAAQDADSVQAAQLNIAKVADQAQLAPGQTLQYTVIISNTGDSTTNADMTDLVPAEVVLQPGSLSSTTNNAVAVGLGITGQTVTWTGSIGPAGWVMIEFAGVVTDVAPIGSTITNTASVTGTGSLLSDSAITTIVAPSAAALTMVKSADEATFYPGNAVQYTLEVSNSGDTAANALVTDTLPALLDYVPNSLVVAGGGSATAVNDVITWNGVITGHSHVMIMFQAELAASATGSGDVVNTAYAAESGNVVSDTDTTPYATSVSLYLPVVMRPVPAPTLLSVSLPESNDQFVNYQMTINWANSGIPGVTYELQEATDANFSAPTTYNAGTNTSYVVGHASTRQNLFYYRLRAVVNGTASIWSNVISQYGAWADDMSDPTSGWSIRREDTDDTENSSYYENGVFVLKIGGRWDYAIASPMVALPDAWDSYQIRTRVIFEDGVDNLHSYGLIFGGDWDGSTCPNSDYSSCFNHYYRLNVIWFGKANRLRIQLKRIDFHEERDNVGRGVTLYNFRDVPVGDSAGWNEWTIAVQSNGIITISVNDDVVATAQDTTYITDRYYGAFAADDEYLGSEPWFDWYRAAPLP